MEIFITGGAGLIGRAVAVHLLEKGYHVRLSDIAPETDVPATSYRVCDIMNFEQLLEQMRACDAVIHLAALRNPLLGATQDVFRINTVGTFNVFEAAAKLGIKRIVQASSINAIGCAWNIGDFEPQYLPIDEDHIQITSDSYSLSKQHIEDIGAYYWRREGITSVALRLPGVYKAIKRDDNVWAERRKQMIRFLDDFQNLPEAEQKRQLAEARHHCLAHRSARLLEYPDGTWTLPKAETISESLLQAYTFDRYNLWAILDERDAALAFELALIAPLEGNHNLFVNDTHNFLGYDSQRLAKLFFPDTPANLQGSEALVSTKRAQNLIGFTPQHSLYGARND